MRIAYYAPLKAPDHPVASGDRELARGLLHALRATGHDVTLASRLRSFDGGGDPVRQARLRRIGLRVAERLITRWQRDDRPDLWFTYHLHHKAPDFLGPAASRVLGIPYVVAEASISPRQRTGPWAEGYADALAAIRAADSVLFLNPADVPEVRKVRPAEAAAATLAPFIDVARFTGNRSRAIGRPGPDTPVRLITVAMMREGAKLASYRALAAALERLVDLRWELSIVGDGPARAEVAAAFAKLSSRVSLLGARPATDVATLLEASDVFAWPAIDEAIGIVFLEAQACGVPVVGANTVGVASVVAAGRTGLLVPPGDVGGLAAAIGTLLLDPALRRGMGANAFDHVREHHDLPTAATRLDAILRSVVRRHRAAPIEITC
ncbi:MAG: glycosyltransferase family 4 protein [Pseudomonadota bacterium]|nr:glycosyltransferase family 4 protein [Pseudomonadota bacterium]